MVVQDTAAEKLQGTNLLPRLRQAIEVATTGETRHGEHLRMSAAFELATLDQSKKLAVYDPDAEIERRYDRWLSKTGNEGAAAVLTLAAAIQRGHPPRWETASMSVQQAATQLGVSKGIVYRLCQEGVMPHTKIGRRITITQAQLEEYRALSQEQPSQLRYV